MWYYLPSFGNAVIIILFVVLLWIGVKAEHRKRPIFEPNDAFPPAIEPGFHADWTLVQTRAKKEKIPGGTTMHRYLYKDWVWTDGDRRRTQGILNKDFERMVKKQAAKLRKKQRP